LIWNPPPPQEAALTADLSKGQLSYAMGASEGAVMGYVIDGTDQDDSIQLAGDPAGGNIIQARRGNDNITSFGLGDEIYAGEGGDVVQIMSQVALADGGAGADTLVFWSFDSAAVDISGGYLTSAGHSAAFRNFEVLSVQTGNGDDNIIGLKGDDFINTAGGDDKVDGGAGSDTLFGGDGADTLYGAAGDDQIYGEAGNDTLRGDDGADTLLGGLGGDVLYGLNGDDRLEGGGGHDELRGGAGNDILIGGEGQDDLFGEDGDGLPNNDTFMFTRLADSTVQAPDNIWDFNSGADKIDLSLIDANTTLGGNQAFTYVGSAAFTAAGQVHVVHNGSAWMIEVNVNADLAPDMAIELASRMAEGPNPIAPIFGGDFIL
jgi:Ca2+-binding RTX toxin-like protein